MGVSGEKGMKVKEIGLKWTEGNESGLTVDESGYKWMKVN